MRKKLPSVIACDAACTDWTTAIKELPPAFASGFSRLASPPPQVHNEPSLHSAWLDDIGNGSAMPPAPPLLHSAPTEPLSPTVVPDSWEDAAENVAKDEEMQALLDPEAEERASANVSNLFVRPQAPLLPNPAPEMLLPARHEVHPSSENRRSARLLNKPKMHAVDKAVHVLNTKMGVAAAGVPLLESRKAYVDKFKTPLPDKAIEAIAEVFKLNIRSLTEADESLIAMGGPGGCEPETQDVPV
jgi:hypothetical protein